MKEQIYTIPLNMAIEANDECPICNLRRKMNNDIMDSVLGAAACMEPNFREITDKEGFCEDHYHKMLKYGNSLGNAWMLKTYFMRTKEQFDDATKSFKPKKKGLFEKKKESENPIVKWNSSRKATCHICKRESESYEGIIRTFLYMWSKDSAFREKIKASKGFCVSHYGDLCDAADRELNEKDLTDFYDITIPLMKENIDRVFEDVSWFIDKYEIQNKDADWKNSKDALQRGMQKMKGGYPADDFYRQS